MLTTRYIAVHDVPHRWSMCITGCQVVHHLWEIYIITNLPTETTFNYPKSETLSKKY